MAIEKTVKVKVDTGSSIEDLQGVEDGFQGIEEQAEDGTAATGGLILAVKGLGLALKTAGIGLAISLLVGLSNAFLTNQRIADLFNTGLEVLNITFKKIINPYIEFVEWGIKFAQTNEDTVKSLGLVTEMLEKGYLAVVNRVAFAWKAATLAYEMSPFGSRDTETITQLKTELREIRKDAIEAGEGFASAAVEAGSFYLEAVKDGEFFTNNLRTGKKFLSLLWDEWKEGPFAIVGTANALVQLRKQEKMAEVDRQIAQLDAQKRAEIQRQIRDDISKSFEERIEANDKLSVILGEQAKTEKSLAQIAKTKAELELSTDKTNIDFQIAKKQALLGVLEIEERITSQESEQKTNRNALLAEQLAAINTEKAALDALNDKKIADAEKVAKTQRAIVTNSLGQISELMGKETAAGKALAIGQALINTHAAAAAALAPPPTGAGPIFGPIAAAGAIAAGMAQVRSIMQTDLPGAEGTGGSGSISTPMGIGGNLIPAPNLDLISPPDFGDPSPVQAYVVENDISDAQALQEELEIQATL